MIKCSNCGADIDESTSRCPYCGFINIAGAEKEYMENLEEIRSTLDVVDDNARTEYSNALKTNGRKIIKAAIIIVLIVIAIWGVSIALGRLEDRLYSESAHSEMERMLWTRENYPKWDELYEAQDYAGLYEEYIDALTSGYSAYDYKHHGIIDAYEHRLEYDRNRVELREGGASDKHLARILTFNGFYFYYREYAYDRSMTDEDIAIADGWREDIIISVYDELGYTSGELEELKGKLFADKYVDYTQCRKISDKRYKEYRIK